MFGFRFRSFQSRIVFFFLGLLSLVQVVVFVTVDVTNTRHARTQMELAVEAGVANFRRLVRLRVEQLAESVRILVGDSAFKQALATRDTGIIRAMLEKHGHRVGADAMLLVSPERALVAASGSRPARTLPPAIDDLLRIAEKEKEATALSHIDDRPYGLVALPVLAPAPAGWLVAGFAIDDRIARDLQQLTKLDVSFYELRNGEFRILASSLDPEVRVRTERKLAVEPLRPDKVELRHVGNEDVLAQTSTFGTPGTPGGGALNALLQRSLDEELRPFQRLRHAVFVLSVAGLALSLFGAFFIARSVTQPVKALAESAREVERGEYGRPVSEAQHDELGDLARAFNRMIKGLAERDKVRNLLGKVVSPAVAKRLLEADVQLGGEERVVTVLFSDLRNFTSFSEQRSPQEVVTWLNEYLTRMSTIIEANQGVVDKYLGDGIMALFGAPVASEDDAGNAIKAAGEMCASLDELNEEFRKRGLPQLGVGIGINTDTVVAGNMGSPSRLNYTVVGDGVNLAARLEALTKEPAYDCRVIIAESTAQAAKFQAPLRPLGKVPVRGKFEPVSVYALVETPPVATPGGGTPA